jgi:DNA (cytosine-5)-methyltransferase 1
MGVVTLTVGSLFSGIGGLDLGLERAGMTVRWQSEIDPCCCRVLAKHWPHVPNLGDIKLIDWKAVEPVDLICGGYPCPAFSQVARGRNVAEDLWPWMCSAIRELRPGHVLLENVTAHLGRRFDGVLGDLATLGFDADWSIVPACALGASHPRERLFVVAYPHGDGESVRPFDAQARSMSPAPGHRRHWGQPSSDDVRADDGVPHRVDRLRALGNAVVPQVAEWIGRRIVEMAS